MEKYKLIEIIGKGSFGEVQKAQNIETGEIVAIKTMKQKYQTWEECMNLRELKSLRKLIHKNVVKLKEVIRQNNQLSFVFEHADLDIFKLYEEQRKSGQKLPQNQIKSIIYQLTQSIYYIHKHGFFHRDLKPENILYNNKTKYVKLIDFGLAREIRSRPPYTDYVSTRWYRAPELLLRSTNYNSPVDIFALGCIMAELFMLKPLFNGQSEQDQLVKISSILGTPSKLEWPEGHRLAAQKGINFPQYPSIPLNTIINNCPQQAIQLIQECLKWDPQKRPTAQKILQHSYFFDIEHILPEDYFNDEQQNKNQNKNIEDQQKYDKSEDITIEKQKNLNQYCISDNQLNKKLRVNIDINSNQDIEQKQYRKESNEY
ncbi:protein kinase domain protein, partial [Ichthyophthirius multifiliis]